MRYIATKKGKEFEITGIKEMEDINGNKVEIKFATKDYDKDKLVDLIENYKKEYKQMCERYENDLKDMNDILTAIKNCK